MLAIKPKVIKPKGLLGRLEQLMAKLTMERQIYAMKCVSEKRYYPNTEELNKYLFKRFVYYLKEGNVLGDEYKIK